MGSTWGAMDGYMRCSPSGHLENCENANSTPCLHHVASGVLSMGPWVEVRFLRADLGYEEGLRLIWGPLACLSWSGTPAKWAHEMTHI